MNLTAILSFIFMINTECSNPNKRKAEDDGYKHEDTFKLQSLDHSELYRRRTSGNDNFITRRILLSFNPLIIQSFIEGEHLEMMIKSDKIL